MKKFTIKNPFEVTEKDTLGSAVIKGLTVGYIRGVVASGIGLGTLALVGHMAHKAELKRRDNDRTESTVETVEETAEAK